ncbi:MAG: hypothetical protein H6597_03360 [Flavobacteriales bacterium]|nr:hypothetical protein [Flavobacteriales bacterium]MCB9193545.1 hypothetical protein [Flavobacteriales bacterium]
MTGPFSDRTFGRIVIAFAVGLAALAFLVTRRSGHLSAAEVVGSYDRPPAPFLGAGPLPGHIELRPDGVFIARDSSGAIRIQASWRWDREEGLLHVSDPVWDHRIRQRQDLLGSHLCMRIDPRPLLDDQPEHDEEVVLERLAP